MTLISTMLADADAAVLRGDIDAATRLYGHVAEQEPANADAWNGVGAMHFEKGELERSLAAYKKAEALARPLTKETFPSNKPLLRALKGIALNLFRTGRYSEAEGVLKELSGLDPDDHMGWSFLLEDIKKGKRLWKSPGAS